MAFTNRIRLPFKLHKAQFETDSSKYRKANGVTVTLSVIVRKVYEGITDNWPEKLHERLKIALSHDDVHVEGDRYVGSISDSGDYSIEWQDFLDLPIAQGKFKAEVTPYNASNSNCGTCEEYAQVVCVDDNAGTLDEDTTYIIDVLANDSICCFPVTISLVTFNTTYLTSAVINPDNTITIHTKTGLQDANSVNLLTYRAQCDNGIFDEANVIGNINGTDPTPVCLAPTNVILTDVSDTTVDFSWTAPSPDPDCGYHWEVKHNIATITSGDTMSTSVHITGLTASTTYTFRVKSNCCDGFESGYTSAYLFSTDPPENTETCGLYEIANDDFPGNYGQVDYIDCNGIERTSYVQGQNSITICALQSGPGSPVQIISSGGGLLNITYLGLC